MTSSSPTPPASIERRRWWSSGSDTSLINEDLRRLGPARLGCQVREQLAGVLP